MKTHYIKLFNYDLFANNETLLLIQQANYPAKPVQLMAHLLAAQQMWINRILGKATNGIELWPSPGKKHEDLEELLLAVHQEWLNYLDKVSDNNLKQTIKYQNTKGEQFSNEIADIITHVINHGTHHRAQIGQFLKLDNQIDLPFMDYIVYVRKLNS